MPVHGEVVFGAGGHGLVRPDDVQLGIYLSNSFKEQDCALQKSCPSEAIERQNALTWKSPKLELAFLEARRSSEGARGLARVPHPRVLEQGQALMRAVRQKRHQALKTSGADISTRRRFLNKHGTSYFPGPRPGVR